MSEVRPGPGGSYADMYAELQHATAVPHQTYDALHDRHRDALQVASAMLLREAYVIEPQRAGEPGEQLISSWRIDGDYMDDDRFSYATRIQAAVIDARSKPPDTPGLLVPDVFGTSEAAKAVRKCFPKGLLLHSIGYTDHYDLNPSEDGDGFRAGTAQFIYANASQIDSYAKYSTTYRTDAPPEVLFPRLTPYAELAKASMATFVAEEFAVFRTIDLPEGYMDIAAVEDALTKAARRDAEGQYRADNLSLYNALASTLPPNASEKIAALANAVRAYVPGQPLPKELIDQCMVPDIALYARLAVLNKNSYYVFDRNRRGELPFISNQLSVIASHADAIQMSLFPSLAAHKDHLAVMNTATVETMRPVVEIAEACARHMAGDGTLSVDPQQKHGHWKLLKP